MSAPKQKVATNDGGTIDAGFKVERITREEIGTVTYDHYSDHSPIEAAFLLIAKQPEKGRYEFLDCIVTVDYQQPEE